MQQRSRRCTKGRARKPLWLAQLHNWLYWHADVHARITLSVCRDHALMSPALRRYLPDDPLYAFPRSVWEELTSVKR